MEAKNKVVYEIPAMVVVDVKAEGIICGSPVVSATRSGYVSADAEEWD